jgi:hypothetical protein
MPKIEANETVILIMHSPREKVWGVLQEINSAGAFLRCVDLDAFEDYISAIIRDEPFIGFCDEFFPLWRIERLIRDEESGGIPSLKTQFERRTGKLISKF